MSLLLDAGAFLAIERGDHRVAALIARERLAGRAPRTHGGVIGQVWRGGRRQARTAQLLRGLEVVPLDAGLGQRAGELLGRARMADVIDAALVLLGADDDELLTSDPDDLIHLAAAASIHVEVVRV